MKIDPFLLSQYYVTLICSQESLITEFLDEYQ